MVKASAKKSEESNTRECGGCTKCCEGFLFGEAKGKKFYGGKPCHFVALGKGCSIYPERPETPCVSFKCAWLMDPEIPEWMKPDQVNAIVIKTEIKGIPFWKLVEAGETLRANVLSQLLIHTMNNQINFMWEISGGKNWIGSPEFIKAMES